MNTTRSIFPSLLTALLAMNIGGRPETRAPKRFGGKHNNNRNHGGNGKRKNPFRGTTFATVIGVSSHI